MVDTLDRDQQLNLHQTFQQFLREYSEEEAEEFYLEERTLLCSCCNTNTGHGDDMCIHWETLLVNGVPCRRPYLSYYWR